MGAISQDNKTSRKVQDVWIKGIALESAAAAIKMIRVRSKRVLSAEEREALLARLPKGGAGRRKRPSPGLRTLDEARPLPKVA
jgi:hypothetical protein